MEAVRGACLPEIFAQTWPRIKGFSSGIQRKQRSDPPPCPTAGHERVAAVFRVLDPGGSESVCVCVCVCVCVYVCVVCMLHTCDWEKMHKRFGALCKRRLLQSDLSLIPSLHHFTWPIRRFRAPHTHTHTHTHLLWTVFFLKRWRLLS